MSHSQFKLMYVAFITLINKLSVKIPLESETAQNIVLCHKFYGTFMLAFHFKILKIDPHEFPFRLHRQKRKPRETSAKIDTQKSPLVSPVSHRRSPAMSALDITQLSPEAC